MRRLLHEETIITEFEPELARRSLTRLVRTPSDRRMVQAYLDRIEGATELNASQRELTAAIKNALTASSRTLKSAPAAVTTRANSAVDRRDKGRRRATRSSR